MLVLSLASAVQVVWHRRLWPKRYARKLSPTAQLVTVPDDEDYLRDGFIANNYVPDRCARASPAARFSMAGNCSASWLAAKDRFGDAPLHSANIGCVSGLVAFDLKTKKLMSGLEGLGIGCFNADPATGG